MFWNWGKLVENKLSAPSAKQGLILNLKATTYALEHNTMDVDMAEICIKKSFEGYRFWNK